MAQKIRTAWPDLNYRTSKGILILLPSNPAIPPRHFRYAWSISLQEGIKNRPDGPHPLPSGRYGPFFGLFHRSAGSGAFTDHVALELGECGKDVKRELAGGCCRVDGFLEGP